MGGPRSGGLDGVLVVAKPAGPTSHDIVALVRRLAATRRVGHGGTLDPFAAGVLPVYLGRATRLVEYHLDARKSYRATVCFGASSTTDDIDGERTPAEGPGPDLHAVTAALPSFTGRILQRPPAFSAVKVAGRRAYQVARAGGSPELPERPVTIHRLELLEWDDRDPARPLAVLEVDCSTGTYIRAIARDLGAAVGNAAYLGSLVRTASGGFRLEDAVTLDALRAAAANGPEGIVPLLRPVDAGLEHLPRVVLTHEEARHLAQGRTVLPAAGLPDDAPGPVLADGPDGRVAAVARVEDGRLAPRKVLAELAS
jgi:tRNA pseudouridine55 synthase